MELELEVTEDGSVILPAAALARLGVKPGDTVTVECGVTRVKVMPKPSRCYAVSMVRDPLTGFVAAKAEPGAPPVTHEEVLELLNG